LNIFDVAQLIGGIILSVGYIFQVKQTIKTKSVEDLNFTSYLSVFIGVGLMEIYAINLVLNGSGLMFLITNSMSLTLAGIMVFLILLYRNKK
jgi:MtN3 and saliva related transmembrane protein